MKRLLFPFVISICCQILCWDNLNAQIGTWTKVTNNAPNENFGTILLMTDGTILCHNATGGTYGTGWDKLTPNASGSYINGTWSTIASMHHDRIAFASQVLPSGNVWVAGGEYGPGDTAAEVYNPLTNAWTVCNGIPTSSGDRQWNIYDAPSELLYNGNVLCGPEIGSNPSFDCLLYTPSTNLFSVAPSALYNHDEAQWLKLPDSSVLFVGIASDNSNRYIPQTNTWVNDANLPVNIYDPYGEESGCGFMLPNGKAIFFGATQYNAIYTPTGNHNPGSWVAAANFPSIQGSLVGQPDAPGAMMVNGHILLAVSPLGTRSNEFQTPTYFVEYNYTTNTFTQVTSAIPGMGGDSLDGIVSQQCTFLDLPDGNVLMSLDQDGSTSREYWVYTPGSGPIPQGKPTINSILPDGCPNYKITGKLFNGISEGSSFGDDMQNASNYPIVRLTNGTNVYYARTSNWNRIGAVQTDSLEDTCVFTLPAIPSGTYSLVVVANGFASNPTLFTVLGISSVAKTNVACAGGTGSATVTASGGLSPLSYNWAPGGITGSTANLGAGTYTITVTDNNGCSATQSLIITQPAALSLMADSVNSSPGNCDGSAWAIVSGGTSPYSYIWTGGLTTDTITNQCAASYCATVSDANGCMDSACVTISTTTGLNNLPKGEQLIVYPNPNNGKFTIELPGLNIQNNAVVEIYNVLGQIVKSNILKTQTTEIDLSPQSPGIYFYRVLYENGGLLGEGKIVVEN